MPVGPWPTGIGVLNTESRPPAELITMTLFVPIEVTYPLPVAAFQAMPRGSPIELAAQRFDPVVHFAGIDETA